jgi:hypothetical protein
MTEKLTYDPTPADAPEFTEDEQDSLKVAERLGQEENDLILGKFKDAEELAKAYSELEKKMGSSDDEEPEVDTEKEEESEYEEAVRPGVELITDASKEYFENEGKLSQETMEKFSGMSSQDLVNAYMAIREKNPNVDTQTEAADLTDAEINTVYNSVGGEKAYQNILNWATDNVDSSKLDAFNSIVNNGDATAIQIAVAGLKAEYDTAEGYEGRMLTGKAARTSGDVYRSQAEVIQAMNDPRYERDPAYRQDVYDKLERSNVDF